MLKTRFSWLTLVFCMALLVACGKKDSVEDPIPDTGVDPVDILVDVDPVDAQLLRMDDPAHDAYARAAIANTEWWKLNIVARGFEYQVSVAPSRELPSGAIEYDIEKEGSKSITVRVTPQGVVSIYDLHTEREIGTYETLEEALIGNNP